RGKLTAFSGSSLADGDFVPQLTGNAPIADRRFASQGIPLGGYITNYWPARATFQESRTFYAWRQAAQATGAGPEKKRNALVLFLFAATSLGMAALLWRGYHINSSNSSTSQKT